MASHASMSDAYDAFLFESLGIEENGMDLSVLSALARAGVDPWAEAKRLAGLPKQAAIAAITAVLNLAGDTETARHLAELLPRTAVSEAKAGKPGIDRQAIFRRYGLVMIVVWLAASVGFMMLNASSNSPPPAPATTGTPSIR
jgi:hypothetical protein